MRIAAMTLVALFYAGIAAAQSGTPEPSPAGSGARARLERLAVLLDLTDSQKLQVQQVLQEEHAQMQALRQQLSASGEKPDWQTMHAGFAQVRQSLLTRIKPLLTDAQFTKFQLLMERPGGRRHGAPHTGAAPPSS